MREPIKSQVLHCMELFVYLDRFARLGFLIYKKQHFSPLISILLVQLNWITWLFRGYMKYYMVLGLYYGCLFSFLPLPVSSQNKAFQYWGYKRDVLSPAILGLGLLWMVSESCNSCDFVLLGVCVWLQVLWKIRCLKVLFRTVPRSPWTSLQSILFSCMTEVTRW